MVQNQYKKREQDSTSARTLTGLPTEFNKQQLPKEQSERESNQKKKITVIEPCY